MGIFRSEIMLRKKIRIPKDNAVEIMNELGKLEDSIEFLDLTAQDAEAKKNYQSMMKRCDEMEKRIASFEKMCENYGEKFVKYKTYSSFIDDLEKEIANRTNFNQNYFDILEAEVYDDEKKITDLIDSYNQINENLEILIEKKCVYDKGSQLILSSEQLQMGNDVRQQRNNMEEGFQSDLNFLAGVIKAEDDLRMKRMIFRLSRGRAIPTFFDLITENKFAVIVRIKQKIRTQKKIFTIFFQGGTENILLNKLIKICDLFGASRYNIPRRSEVMGEIGKLQNEINEKKNFLKQAENSIREFIRNKVGFENSPAKYELHRLFFRKEKMIFQNLNKCRSHDNFLDGEVWIPEDQYNHVQDSLKKILAIHESKLSASLSDPSEREVTPPTHIKTNDFTWAFQEIVNTYGIPRYREINPALFNIVTFPFLFGVMFGDIGHGSLLLLFAIYLCWFRDDIIRSDNPLKPALKGRYLLLLMGIFATFNGWMYNDFLSIPLGIFGTCYKNVGEIAERKSNDCVYPFGLDPKWYVASNELAFFNSLKMKTSVILGVVHMLFGIFLRGLNSIHFGSKVDFLFEFIPQFIFMSILFGYMNVMIFVKWSIDWFQWLTPDQNKFIQAPSIISQLMNIFLAPGNVGKMPIWGEGDAQSRFHILILIIAVSCLPVLLIPKPLFVYFSQKKKPDAHYQEFQDEHELAAVHGGGNHHHEEPFSEIFVHSAIETIEFVLGGISNTASYLRLWALSLAHAQLAKVFFEKALLSAIHEASVINIFIGFFIFANVTFFVLMCMDLMECFLHTLRLHWVEFQGKFYKADGYKFSPFCFKYMVEADE